MAEITQNVLNEDLENLENKISIIALSDPKKYEGFNLRLKTLQDSLIGLSGLEFEQRKKDIIAEITSIKVDFDSYMDGSDALPEDSLKQGLELTSGRAKLRGYRVGLYKSIVADLKKLDYIDIDDLRKLTSKWLADKQSDEYQFSPFEISLLSEELSDVFLDYQIKELQRTGKMPSESIENFTTLEDYQKSLKNRLIQVSRTEKLSFSDKLELDNLVREPNLEKLVGTPDLWRILTSKDINISNDVVSKLLNKEVKEKTNPEKEENSTTALVPVEPKKQGLFANLFNKKEVPYMIITLGEKKNGEKKQKKIKLKDGVAKLPVKYQQYISDWFVPSAVTEVFLSEGVTKINNRGFYNWKNLEKVHLPTTLESIGDSAFEKCPKLSSIEIPNSVKEIGGEAFCDCESLESIKIPEGVKKLLACTFAGCTELKNIDLPSTLETICSGVFRECTKLENVKLPSNLKAIEGLAFYVCKNLKNINFHAEIKHIGFDAFRSCWCLERVELPESIEELGDNAFMDCNRVREVIIKGLIPKLGYRAFYGCESLERVEVPEDFRFITSDIFGACENLNRNIVRVPKKKEQNIEKEQEKISDTTKKIETKNKDNNNYDEI